MDIKITASKLTDAPYSAESANAFLFDDSQTLQQFLLELHHARAGSYLISGYRGSGKTSFVNRIAQQLTDQLIVEFNISKSIDYPVLVKKIIRQLFLQYIAFSGVNKINDKDFETDFQLLYDRTFHEITRVSAVATKDETKSETRLEFNLKKLIPYFLILVSGTGISLDKWVQWPQYVILVASVFWACVSGFNIVLSGTTTATKKDDLSRKSLYDDEIAEYHLFDILKRLKKGGIKILIVFDELDKLQDDFKKNDTTEDKIGQVINDLKPLLLSGYASFMIVAGQQLYYDLEKATYKDDLVINTLFSKTIHIPFLKNATLKAFCIGLINETNDRSNPIVNGYFDSLILHSRRVPRKLVNLIRAGVIWDGPQAILRIDESKSGIYGWKTRVLQAVSAALDNKLAVTYADPVQLDFYIAQCFIWLGKMMGYTRSFSSSDFFNLKNFEDYYPENYIVEIPEVWNILVEALEEEKLLKLIFTDEDTELFYSWIQIAEDINQPQDPDREGNSVSVGDEHPDPVDYTNPNTEIPEQITKQSLFLTDLAELEAYVRTLYLEVEPNAPQRNQSLQMLIDKLCEIGVLSRTWQKSSKLKRLLTTRNHIAHGLAIGQEDLDEVRSSTASIARLRGEINEEFTFYIAKMYMSDVTLEKSSKGGFDFIALMGNYQLAIEVKSSKDGKLDSRTIAELASKYTNYEAITQTNLYYIIFYFQPAGRKSMDDFYIQFNKNLENALPNHHREVQLFYITTADERGIRQQIEIGLSKVFDEIDPSLKNIDL